MDVQTLAEGLVLQSGMDGVEIQGAYFEANSLKAKKVYVEKKADKVTQQQAFFVIPVEKDSLLVEIGSYAGAPERADVNIGL